MQLKASFLRLVLRLLTVLYVFKLSGKPEKSSIFKNLNPYHTKPKPGKESELLNTSYIIHKQGTLTVKRMSYFHLYNQIISSVFDFVQVASHLRVPSGCWLSIIPQVVTLLSLPDTSVCCDCLFSPPRIYSSWKVGFSLSFMLSCG